MKNIRIEEDFMNYVEKRLDHWAQWYSTGNYYGLGFHSETIEYVLMTVGVLIKSTSIKPTPCDEEAEEIEALIIEMAKHNIKMAMALKIQYLSKRKARDRSAELNVCATKFRIYVDMAKQWLAGRLSGGYR
ncbi:MAG: hypothetical protein ABI370_07530 [Gammaproteobacteria bacterium]